MTAGRGQLAMTLVELVVAMTLTVLVTGSTAAVLRGVAAARSRVDRQMLVQQEARVAARAIVTVLRNAHRNPGNDFLLEGVDAWQGRYPADRIRFLTISRRTIRPGEPESDVRECEFFLAEPKGEDEFPVLVRRMDPTRNQKPDDGGVLEPVARNVLALDFAYHDGIEWTDRWPESRREWPAAIRVWLTVGAEAKPRREVTVSRIVSFPYVPRPERREQE